MLNRLSFNPSTNSTSLIIIESWLPTSPLPRILPSLLSPYVTKPFCLIFKFINFEASPVICFETTVKVPQLLLGYPKSLQNKLSCKSWSPINLGSIHVNGTLRNPLHKAFRQIIQSSSTSSNCMASFQTIETSDR